MSRAVWFVAGASAGVYAMNKARQFAGSLNAEGLRARWHGVTHGARLLAQDAKQAQVVREDELRERMGLPAVNPDATRQLKAAGARRTPPVPALIVPSPAENDPARNDPTSNDPAQNDSKDTH